MKRPREERHPCGLFVSGNEMFFRPMNPADLDAVMNIERASFSYPWSPGFFLQELRIPCARSLIALMGGKIVAYVIYWLLPDEMDIHNLAVHSAYRRQGIGRSLLQEVIDEARRNGSSRVTLEVRRSNEAAQRLYYSLGFVERGVRKGYYSADGEDALAMALEFDS